MRALLLVICIFLFSAHLPAQSTTGFSGTGDNIDVKYHRLEWDINPDNPIWVAGKITTYFVTTKDSVERITFDLNRLSYNNPNLQVYYHGSPVSTSFPQSGNRNILRIQLPAALAVNVLDSVTIQYAGTPPIPSGGPGGCFQKTIIGYSLFYTLSESYEDRDWWPCKADMQDKIDSIDIIIKSPTKYTAAANGTLISETISGSTKTSVFKHRYPIASYQIGIAVSEYDKYDRGSVSIGGVDVPIMYYFLKGRNPSEALLNQIDACKQQMVVFSELFGDYPFKNEKYGMYEFGFNGGMEHNTFSGMSWSAYHSSWVVAHELVHQWFGDKVTMATWNHLWLSEGFASYGEVLAAERVSATGINPVSHRNAKKNEANSPAQRVYGCYIPEEHITSSGALWGSQYGKTVYTRGGMVVSMLRTLMGDERFFRACRNYLNDPELAYRSAVTSDLQRHLEAELDGFDLTGFFNSFVFGNGYPSYSGDNAIQWQAVGTDRIRFRRTGQQKSAGSDVDYYHTVIPLRVRGNGGKDTLIVLYDQGNKGVSIGGNGIRRGNSPTPEVYLGFIPTSVSFDPEHLGLATGSTMSATIASVNIHSFKAEKYENTVELKLELDINERSRSVVLEKSFDGTRFSILGKMQDRGNERYSYRDEMSEGVSYYRAKITEASGETSFTEIVRVSGKPAHSFSLISNPVRNNIDIKVPIAEKGKSIRVTVMDASGRQFIQTDQKLSSSRIRLDGRKLSKGTYFLLIQGEKRHELLQFIVVR